MQSDGSCGMRKKTEKHGRRNVSPISRRGIANSSSCKVHQVLRYKRVDHPGDRRKNILRDLRFLSVQDLLRNSKILQACLKIQTHPLVIFDLNHPSPCRPGSPVALAECTSPSNGWLPSAAHRRAGRGGRPPSPNSGGSPGLERPVDLDPLKWLSPGSVLEYQILQSM